MNEIFKKCINASFEDFLSKEEFIEAFEKNPEDWIAFRNSELVNFVNLILNEVNKVIGSCLLEFDQEYIKEKIKEHFNQQYK